MIDPHPARVLFTMIVCTSAIVLHLKDIARAIRDEERTERDYMAYHWARLWMIIVLFMAFVTAFGW